MTLDLSHLSTAAKEQAFQDSATRIHLVQTARWVGFARAQLALEELEHRFKYPTCARMPCMLLYGESGMGKTMILETNGARTPELPPPSARPEHMLQPWPTCPRPFGDESLHSWFERVASVYDLPAHRLLSATARGLPQPGPWVNAFNVGPRLRTDRRLAQRIVKLAQLRPVARSHLWCRLSNWELRRHEFIAFCPKCCLTIFRKAAHPTGATFGRWARMVGRANVELAAGVSANPLDQSRCTL